MLKPFLIISWESYSREAAARELLPGTALPEVKSDTVAVARRNGGTARLKESWQDLGAAGYQLLTWLGPTYVNSNLFL